MAFLQEKQEEFDVLMQRLDGIINEEKFNDMLHQQRIYKHKFEDLIWHYVTYNPMYNPHMFDDLTMEEWALFADVVDFSECPTILKYRDLMNKFLRNFPRLRAKTLQGVYEKFHQELDLINNETPLVVNSRVVIIPFLNWTPYYGGIISPQLRFGARYRKWALANSVCYYASPNQAVMTQAAEAKYAAGYERASQDIEDIRANEPEVDPATL